MASPTVLVDNATTLVAFERVPPRRLREVVLLVADAVTNAAAENAHPLYRRKRPRARFSVFLEIQDFHSQLFAGCFAWLRCSPKACFLLLVFRLAIRPSKFSGLRPSFDKLWRAAFRLQSEYD